MTRFTSIRLFAAAAVVAAGFVAIATPGQASITNKLEKCDGASRHEVVKCCDAAFRNNANDFLLAARPDCNRHTVCSKKAFANYCRVVLVIPHGDDRDHRKGKR